MSATCETPKEAKGGKAFEIIVEEAKSPAVPKVQHRNSLTREDLTREDIVEKLQAAEERRKQHETELLSKLAEQDKHAAEVRAKRNSIGANPQAQAQGV